MLCEGVEYKPWKDGAFRCPNKCGNPDYPQPSWKTEKGFAKHLGECRAKPEARLVWKPEPKVDLRQFGNCPDCGVALFEGQSCWWMQGDMVCIGCYRPYFEAGIGHHDAVGLELPGMALEG